ncbi:MAG: PKD domain-containing protein [Candidatus Marinimicrobia bacterium]|nr:PKD domain-containing protein [Candidatus Neomarinimicrobiota bacterium]
MKKLIVLMVGLHLISTIFAQSDKDWEVINKNADYINGYVLSISHDDSNNVYFGGDFTTINDVTANNIGGWNGTNWLTMETGTSSIIEGLALDSLQNLYVAGRFRRAGDVSTIGIAMWNGINWQSVGGGTNSDVLAITFDNDGNLYAGGWFTMAGGVSANYVAKWDGTQWSPLGSGMSGIDHAVVNALAFDKDGNLYAGGIFNNAGGVSVNGIAKWDGTSWSALGGGLPCVMTIACDSTGNVYAGGEFSVGGKKNIAVWDGSSWKRMGNGSKRAVHALALDDDGNLYAGSYWYLEEPIRFISKWNGSEWSSLGSGVNKGVNALCYDNGRLYVGGCFTVAGGKASPYFASIIVDPTNVTFKNGLDCIIDTSFASENQLLGKFSLSAEKSIGHLDAINITLKGVRNGFSQFKLWESNDDIFNPENDTQLDTTIIKDPGCGNTLDFLNFTSNLDTVETYYFLTSDIAPDASGVISAEIADNNAVTICGGDINTIFENEPLSASPLFFPCNLSIKVYDDVDSVNLVYGWANNASDSFDVNLDQYAPILPPENTFDARFSIAGKDYIKDYRSTINTGEYIIWDLYLQCDSLNESIQMEWDPTNFPSKGYFFLRDTGSVNIDMRKTNHYTSIEMDSCNLHIVYTLFHSDFDVNIKQGTLPLTIQFTDMSLGDVNSWYWQFGDGGTSTEQNPQYIYQSKGCLSVSLTVSDGSNTNEYIKEDLIIVNNQEKAIIREITDVPGDQGGWVYIDFSASIFDTDTITSSGEKYRIKKLEGENWVVLDSVTACGLDNYRVILPTQVDSCSDSSGIFELKILTEMQEGVFESNTKSGYSVDNLSPEMPTGLDLSLYTDAITLDWNDSPESDFDHYNIYRGLSKYFSVGEGSLYEQTTESTFIDSAVRKHYTYYYRISAVDVHDNESNPCETAGLLVNIDIILEDFELSQNYPNPFNPITTIQYGLPKISDVHLSIFDIRGRKIKEFNILGQQPGCHKVIWDGTDMKGNKVSTGVYIYSLQASDFVETKKMVLMK